MEIEQALGLVTLAWLIGSVLLMARLVRRGQAITDTLEARHPETYEALGRPRPGLLHSPRRNRFARFLATRAYQDLDDAELSTRFDDYRKAETRLLKVILVSLAVIAVVILAVRQLA